MNPNISPWEWQVGMAEYPTPRDHRYPSQEKAIHTVLYLSSANDVHTVFAVWPPQGQGDHPIAWAQDGQLGLRSAKPFVPEESFQ